MDYITLYADEHDTDVWEEYCKICGVPTSATYIEIHFDHNDCEYGEDGEDD